jgi:hypothetical protein
MNDENSVLVEDRPDGVYVTVSDYTNGPVKLLRSAIEILHSMLARNGYKRIGKQQGSDIGGTYTK